MKNFHLPLSEDTYTLLRAEAKRMQVPATTLAREAVDSWLRQQFRKGRQHAIEAYAAEMAGTHLDLDSDLESARDRASRENRQGGTMKRGDVYWADLVPRSGSEQTGRRPVVVVSHDGFNQTPHGGRSLWSRSQHLHRKASVDLPSLSFRAGLPV